MLIFSACNNLQFVLTFAQVLESVDDRRASGIRDAMAVRLEHAMNRTDTRFVLDIYTPAIGLVRNVRNEYAGVLRG